MEWPNRVWTQTRNGGWISRDVTPEDNQRRDHYAAYMATAIIERRQRINRELITKTHKQG